MNLTELQKTEIKKFYSKLDDAQSMDISYIVEETLDYLLDENIIDLSDDEDGDMYESYNNSVWEYIEKEVQS
jgi:hypothetical protein